MTRRSTGRTGEIERRAFLNALDCRTQGWFERKAAEKWEPSDKDLFHREQKWRVRKIAWSTYPNALLVSGDSWSVRTRATQDLMAWRGTQTVLHAAFRAKGHVARADVATRVRGGWKLTLLTTSKKRNQRPKKQLLDRAGFLTMVAQAAGVRVQAVELLMIAPSFRRSMDDESLLVAVDVTTHALERANQWEPLMNAIRRSVRAGKRPKAVVCPSCNSCSYANQCLFKGIAHPVTDLPNLRTRILKLPTRDIAKLPVPVDGVQLTDEHKRIIQSVQSGKEHIGSEVASELKKIKRPTYYLDFETTATVYPLYADFGPFDPVLTQYSLHRVSRAGKLEKLDGFLADPTNDEDEERELAQQLIDELGSTGTIVVYSSFEQKRIEALQARFPDLAHRLARIIQRLFDLLDRITGPGHYYHPDFRGSASIKAVQPVLGSTRGYEGMPIAEGGDASIAFARMALGELTQQERYRYLGYLREYCDLDSRAMYDIHQTLLKKSARASSRRRTRRG